MQEAHEIVRYANFALFTVVALLALWHWRRHRERAGVWAALAFGALGGVVDLGELIPEERDEPWEEIAVRALIAVLVLFPYFLYRFAVAFRPPSRRLALLVGGLTVVLVIWTFALPDIPQENEEWPRGYGAYVAAFVVHWTLLTIVVTWRLWSAGRGEPSVPRRRMRLLAVAAATITLALLTSVATSNSGPGAALVAQLLASLSAILFAVGLVPPALLRMAWRRPEQDRLQNAIGELMSATTTDEVVERVLPHMAGIVGARAVSLRDAEGNVIGFTGEDIEGGRLARITTPDGGEVRVWTSPYAPFFGTDELALLRTLAALTTVALDRARLFTQERESRVALERADELKTNFVALAAHELRTPVATVHGLVETIYARRADLDDDQLHELESALSGQTRRLKALVEQLLDLSRLEADAVEIDPQRVQIRGRVEEIVAASAGAGPGGVEIDVDPGLEVDVDPHAFDRIVSNLVANALRYGGAPVKVTAQQTDRHFRLRVEDRGPGVAPDFVPDLFERFSRSADARRRAGGTGLGLAIARSYALAHKGDLIYAPAEPKGASFELVLPVR